MTQLNSTVQQLTSQLEDMKSKLERLSTTSAAKNVAQMEELQGKMVEMEKMNASRQEESESLAKTLRETYTVRIYVVEIEN